MARKKVRIKNTSRKNTKKTSIGRRPKMSSMNKHKKRSYKPRNRGGNVMKVSENTSVAMPIKNMIGIIIGVSYGYLCLHRNYC